MLMDLSTRHSQHTRDAGSTQVNIQHSHPQPSLYKGNKKTNTGTLIHMFLDLPDPNPDPLDRDLDPDPSISKQK
jgi:hypothetical protein